MDFSGEIKLTRSSCIRVKMVCLGSSEESSFSMKNLEFMEVFIERLVVHSRSLKDRLSRSEMGGNGNGNGNGRRYPFYSKIYLSNDFSSIFSIFSTKNF